MRQIGKSYPSITNRKLVAGKGTFVADIQRPRMLHLAVVRSPYAAARILNVDSAAAEATPGVVRVIAGREIKDNMNPIFSAIDTEAMGAKSVKTYALCPDRVRYVGEAVAAVVAEDKYTAHLAADRVVVDYEELPVVTDAREAMHPDSPLVEPDWGDNILVTRDFVKGDPDKAFEDAELTSSGELYHHRYTGAAIEPRAYLADYDPYSEKLTYWASTQTPHPTRVFLAETLGISENAIRVIQPNVGGAFGLKIPTFQEEPLVAYLAMQLERPVKFVSERTEDLLVGGHAREMHLSYEVAFQKDGKITGLKAQVVADVGVPSALAGWGMSFVCSYSIPTCYKVEHARVRLFSVVTNKCPWNAYRGYGKESASFLMDRVLDDIAKRTGLDRVEVRMKNFIQPDEFPYPQVSGAMLDSGNYPGAMKKVLEMIDYEGFPRLQQQVLEEGRHIGLGIGQELTPEGCGMPRSTLIGSWDGATVRVNPSGEVTVLSGVTSPGGGNETALAQIAADELGVPFERVSVIQGDTETCPYGLGNYSSRSIIMGGSAVYVAAHELREKMLKVAGRMLEVGADEVEVEDGNFFGKGAPSRNVSFKEVASTVYHDCHGVAACDVEPGLEVTRYFQHPNVYHQPEAQGRFSTYPSWPNQSVAMIVEVDPETGKLEILKYCAVHDSGLVVNPLLADANLHGGIVQGIGGAMFEQLVYDDAGQLLTTTFMDYTCPTAVDVPSFELAHQETPSPFTPTGAKGVGESGVTGPLGGLCSAIENAFPDLDLRFTALPLTPNAVWKAIREAREARA